MDAAHLHMEMMNRKYDAGEAIDRCAAVLDAAGALPGQPNDPGERTGIDLAKALGDEIKEMIRDHAAEGYGLDFDGPDLTATLYSVFVGHISSEALGDLFYQDVRARYGG